MNRKMFLMALISVTVILLTFAAVNAQGPQPQVPSVVTLGTAFTYQGQLKQNGNAVSGNCDLQFSLYDAANGGTPIGSPQTATNVSVSNGLFTTQIDFGGGAFNGDARFLEIAVRCPAGSGSFTTLSRQALTPAPYAVYAPSAGSVPWSGLTGVPAGFADGVDNDTTYTAGTGLELSGTQFSLASAYQLPQSCANNQVAKWNGSAWTCANDNDTTTLAGDVTGTLSATTVIGLQGRNVASTAPTSGQVLKWDGSQWAPGTDADTTYTASTGLSLSGTEFSVATTYRLPQSCSNDQVAKWNGSAWTCANANDTTTFWSLLGNAGTNPSTNFLGTSDNMTFTVRVSNTVALQIAPASDPTYGFSPNLIGGYSGNSVTSGVVGATISGGGSPLGCSGPCPNRVTANFGTVGGGYNNTASGSRATVGGGVGNTASGYAATVGGGQSNTASANFATVGGGVGNTASGESATAGGGDSNTASANFATVGGGASNTASGNFATVGGGDSNTAAGDYSFVVGRRAKNTNANHAGVFIFADSTFADLTSTTANQFLVRASGGITMYTNSAMSVGVKVNPGSGTWASLSDRAVKANFAEVDTREILARVAALPIQTWNYQSQAETIRHIGPMAQDFYAAFGVGEDDRYITSVDAEGIAVAAIQGLYQVVQEKDAQIAAQQKKIDDLEARLAALERGAPMRAEAFGRPQGSPLQDSNAIAIGALLLGALALYRAKRGAK